MKKEFIPVTSFKDKRSWIIIIIGSTLIASIIFFNDHWKANLINWLITFAAAFFMFFLMFFADFIIKPSKNINKTIKIILILLWNIIPVSLFIFIMENAFDFIYFSVFYVLFNISQFRDFKKTNNSLNK